MGTLFSNKPYRDPGFLTTSNPNSQAKANWWKLFTDQVRKLVINDQYEVMLSGEIIYPSQTPSPSDSLLRPIDLLLVGGGGPGGWSVSFTSGGGGAGGYVYIPRFYISSGIYDVFIGSGGTCPSLTGVTNGGDTTGFGRIALGGGHGGNSNSNGADGGCGGGAGSAVGGSHNYLGGNSLQGKSGGDSNWIGGTGISSGAGGGIAQIGGTSYGLNNYGLNGGEGFQFFTFGDGYYGGGGGGAGDNLGGNGGSSIGGRGGYSGDTGTAGAVNTGSGGGGLKGTGSGNNGGSGIAKIKFYTGDFPLCSVTGGTITYSGSYTIVTFTSNGNISLNVIGTSPTPSVTPSITPTPSHT